MAGSLAENVAESLSNRVNLRWVGCGCDNMVHN